MSYRLFVGNLPMDVKEREIDDLFYKYGRIRDIDLKTPSRPPAYAFVSFDDERDAEDAIRARDGYTYDGYRLRVEFARGKDGGRSEGSRDIRRDERRRPAGRRTEHRVIVTGLPRSASWQDLKDHMRKAGDVIYADVDHNGEGVVEFSNREDMEAAVRKLDDTEFKNPFDKSYIRVKYANKKSRSRSVSPKGRSVSRSRSRDRGGKDRKNDRRRSSSLSNSRSPSRSRSPSPKRSSRKVDEDEDDDEDNDRKPRRRSEDDEDDVVVARDPQRLNGEEDGSDADLNNDD